MRQFNHQTQLCVELKTSKGRRKSTTPSGTLREPLRGTAVPHGGNPQDRTVSPFQINELLTLSSF
uniref:Uncharacterized protein n=1 Tax=[Tolypothrix] sp. PCC 7415 TaxID=373957 RepID=A0A2P0ZGC9_9CYAN|nr:hypothetical protein [[Tolypothrix] sp. PCC 7415]